MAHVELSDGCDMGAFQEGSLIGSTVSLQSSSQIQFTAPDGSFLKITGQGLTYGGPNGTLLTGGVVQTLTTVGPGGGWSITGANADGAVMGSAFTQNDSSISQMALMAGDDDIHVVDSMAPTASADHTYVAFGHAGNDLMVGGGTLSTFFGGTGADTLQAATAATSVLLGEAGDDSLAGGAGADTLTGGSGHDVLSGGAGGDLFIIVPGDSGTNELQVDRITDWQASDHLTLGRAAAVATNYIEGSTAADFAGALSIANSRIVTGGADFVVLSVGNDVIVFADSRGDDGVADDAVVLSGRTLADISAANIVAGRPLSVPAEPAQPVSPAVPLIPSAVVGITGTLDQAHLGNQAIVTVTSASSTQIGLTAGNLHETITGSGFVYDGGGDLIGGTVTGVQLVQTVNGVQVLNFNATFGGQPVSVLAQLEGASDPTAAIQLLLGANPKLVGSLGAEEIHGGTGQDLMWGGGGHDSLFGGAGGDIIFTTAPWGQAGTAAPSSGYLRGEDGNDYLVGNAGFDDINGNMGNDTGFGGLGDDWVVGGKDNDMLFGDAGGDIVYGNLGDDSCIGGTGADLARGGQGDDMLWGGEGDDWLSGDRGSDTLVGGTGADIFHTFGDAGVDRVLDFTVVEGDRVQLDPGTQATVAQVGADVVISMTGGGQMTLVGVQLSTLPAGWIFGA